LILIFGGYKKTIFKKVRFHDRIDPAVNQAIIPESFGSKLAFFFLRKNRGLYKPKKKAVRGINRQGHPKVKKESPLLFDWRM